MESNQEPGISPQNWQGCGWASCTSLDNWRCSISFATVVDEAIHERQPYTTTKILQLPVEPSQNGDGGVLLVNLREGGGFCSEEVSAARRIRRRQPLLVLFHIMCALKKLIR